MPYNHSPKRRMLFYRFIVYTLRCYVFGRLSGGWLDEYSTCDITLIDLCLIAIAACVSPTRLYRNDVSVFGRALVRLSCATSAALLLIFIQHTGGADLKQQGQLFPCYMATIFALMNAVFRQHEFFIFVEYVLNKALAMFFIQQIRIYSFIGKQITTLLEPFYV